MTKSPNPLNRRQQIFVDEYMANGFNATQAAIKAGYAIKSAHNTGYRMMKNEDVLKVITQRMAATAEEYDINYDTIMQEHASIGFAKPRGEPSFTDKRGSLDSMAKLAGLITDKHDVTYELTFEGFREQWGKVIEDAGPGRKSIAGK